MNLIGGILKLGGIAWFWIDFQIKVLNLIHPAPTSNYHHFSYPKGLLKCLIFSAIWQLNAILGKLA